MRKGLCLMLVFVLTLSLVCCTGLAEEESRVASFTPTMTNLMKKQAKEWMSTDDTRAMATVLLVVDLITALDSSDGLISSDGLMSALTQATYIGKEGLDLIVYLHAGENDILILYRPVTGEAGYSLFDVAKDEAVQMVLDLYCTDGYYKNDYESVYAVLQGLQDIFSAYT